MKTRKPAVAGQFYPDDKNELIEMLSSIYAKEKSRIDTGLSEKKIIGGVVPHAGYIYSGYEAIHFFEIIKNSKQKFDTIFIINPDHSGYGAEIALDDNDYWETPLGKVELDKDFLNALNLPVSGVAHKYEHSGEVMLPFLQYTLDYTYKIVPVTISKQNYENAKKVANAIYDANNPDISGLNKKILLIASSDFSHYVEPKIGEKLDNFVLEEILSLNSPGIHKTVTEKNISVCGYGPIMALVEYAKLISPDSKAKILRKGHSGEVMPSNEVVDYVSILFFKD